MSLQGKQTINIGLPNEQEGSDNLYVAFNKIKDNFDVVFACASSSTTFVAGTGIEIDEDSGNATITITNTITTETVITYIEDNGLISLVNTDGDIEYAGLTYSSTDATLTSVINPAGDTNTLRAEMSVSAGTVSLLSNLESLSGNSFGNVEVNSGSVSITVSDGVESPKIWTFDTDGSLSVPGETFFNNNIYGGTNDRLWLGGSAEEGTPQISLPNNTDGASQPITINNGQGGGVQITTGAGNWTFGEDGSLTLPGALVLPTEGLTDGTPASPTALSLDKQVQILSGAENEGFYSLANGVQGQVMYFTPVNSGVYVIVANARIRNTGTGAVEIVTDYSWQVDYDAANEAPRTIAMAIFVNGAWNLTGGATD